MVDFPSTPADGDTHTEEGTTWVYTNGAWVVFVSGGSTGTEIVESDSSTWQVVGDMLMTVNRITTDSGSGNWTLIFPKEFKSTPAVTFGIQGADNVNADTVKTVGAPTTTQVAIKTNLNGTNVSRTVNVIAVGEALDADKKPKVVQTLGGSELQEFHDPAGLASWRIVGSTLECWGNFDTDGLATAQVVTLPKTYADTNFSVTYGINDNGNTSDASFAAFGGSVSANEIHVNSRLLRATSIAPNVINVSWRTVGTWDGVS